MEIISYPMKLSIPMDFNGINWWLTEDFMGLTDDALMISWDLMGFNDDLITTNDNSMII